MKLTDVTGKPNPAANKCPRCGGEAVEVTANGDSEYKFVCNRGCGHSWGVAFARMDEQPAP